jgi:hypothetical protein
MEMVVGVDDDDEENDGCVNDDSGLTLASEQGIQCNTQTRTDQRFLHDV